MIRRIIRVVHRRRARSQGTRGYRGQYGPTTFEKCDQQLGDEHIQGMLKTFHESSPWKKAAGDAREKQVEAGQAVCRTHALLSELKSCSQRRDLQWGRRIHAKAVQSRTDSNSYVVTALIRMYAKCRSMVDARRVFDSVEKPELMSWNALLLGYTENGEGNAALDLFWSIKARGYTPNSVTYVAALKACTSLAVSGSKGKCLERGRQIHSEIGGQLNQYVQSTLIDMYAKCGSIVDARPVFDIIQNPDVVSWNALLLGYAENGKGLAALNLFARMKERGCLPNSVTYIAALKACTCLAVNGDGSGKAECLRRGREIHSEIGCHLNHYVQNTLMGMYAKCGSMVEARRVFDAIPLPDVVSWNVLCLGYAENGEGHVALELLSSMKTRGCVPNSVTYVASLKACTALALNGDKGECLDRGRDIHLEIGCHLNLYVQNTLIDMYAKCGSMVDARRVFDSIQRPDVISWTALILGYADCGEGHAALDLFSRMKASRCAPNPVTYVAALKACTALALNGDGTGKECLQRGREIHSEIGCNLDHYVQSTLIDMYTKCGSMADARRVFDSIPNPDVVSWSSLLLGYAEHGNGFAALELFPRMKCAPSPVTYIAVLKACGLVGALALGRKFHSEISEFTAHVVTCLVDFYAKCGSMVEAQEVFDLHSGARDASTWNALLAGYGTFGDTVSVFNLFEAMQDAGFRPNAITFVCMLLCCSHAGLVEKAREFFEAMPVQYEVTPSVMHYNCMIDVLGRANQLNEAVAFLRKMPCSPDVVTWRALLGACRKWKNVEIGRLAFQSLVDMDKEDGSAYILMAHIYGSRGMWQEQQSVLAEFGARKLPGQAYVMDEVGRMVNFQGGEQGSPEVEHKLEELRESMEELAESCSMSCITADAEKETLCGHSERRAVVYGILKIPPGEPVRVFKNARMCDDCHGSTKAISKFLGRLIMVRDTSRFHVMENGSCSCGDYW